MQESRHTPLADVTSANTINGLPFMVPNLGQFAELSRELPLPRMDFSSNTYLLDSSILQAQAQQYLTNPSPELVHHAAMLLSQVDQTEIAMGPGYIPPPNGIENTSPLMFHLHANGKAKSLFGSCSSPFYWQGFALMLTTKAPQLGPIPKVSKRVSVTTTPLSPPPEVQSVLGNNPNGKQRARKTGPEPKTKPNAAVNSGYSVPVVTELPEEARAGDQLKPVPDLPELGHSPDPLRKFERYLTQVAQWVAGAALENGNIAQDDALPEPLDTEMVTNLTLEIQTLSNLGMLSQISETDITQLVSGLHAQVKYALAVMLQLRSNTGSAVQFVGFRVAMSGLEAAQCLLTLVSSSDAPKSALHEEPLEAALELVRQLMKKVIFPAFDPSYRDTSQDATNDIGHGDEEEPTSIDEDPAPSKKKTKKGMTRKAKQHHVDPKASKMLAKLNQIFNRLVDLISGDNTFPDSIVIVLASCSIPVFFVEGIPTVQLAALNLACATFSRYPLHRPNMLDDIISSLIRLPTAKRNLRAFKLPDHDKKSIQMVTALIMQLVHCSCGLPDASGDTNTNMNSYLAAFHVAQTFIDSLIAKCSKSNDDKDSDYKPILQNLAEDLMLCVHMPEWPSAEVMLKQLIRRLAKKIINEDGDASTELRQLAISLMGAIGAKVRQDFLRATQKHLFSEPARKNISVDGESPDDELDERCAMCKSENDARFMLDCDNCHRWFHGECVGVDQDSFTGTWFCDQCLIMQQIDSVKKRPVTAVLNNAAELTPVRKKSRSRRDEIALDDVAILAEEMDVDLPLVPSDPSKQAQGDDDDDDEAYKEVVEKQLILNYLANRDASDPVGSRYARRFYLGQWGHEDEDDTNYSFYRAQMDASSVIDAKRQKLPTLTPSGISQVVLHLAENRGYLQGFPQLLKYILWALSEKEIKIKTKALKALGTVVEADPSVLNERDVYNSVKQRFLDPSIMVREAAIDLVGKFIAGRPDLAAQYYDVISERIHDAGVSVRKRVVKISRAICLSQPTSTLVSKICSSLSSRLSDEQDIRKLVMGIFKDLWFRAATSSEDELPPDATKALASFTISNRMDQVIEVVSGIHSDTPALWLTELILGLLKDEEGKRLQPMADTCAAMCTAIMERLLHYEEERVKLPENDLGVAPLNEQKAACLVVLSRFCQARPQLLLPHAESLMHYLEMIPNADGTTRKPKEEPRIIINVTSILEATIPILDGRKSTTVTEIATYLGSLIHNQGTLVVHSCAKAFCSIVSETGEALAELKELHSSFFKFLVSAAKSFLDPKKPIPDAHRRSIIRSLFCLGTLCRYYKFDGPNKALPKSHEDIAKVRYGQYVEEGYGLVKTLWGRPESDVKAMALKSIGFLCVSYPALLLRSEELIKSSIDSKADPKVRNQALQTITEFLAEEEGRMNELGKKSAVQTTKNQEKENADSGVSGTLIQKLLQRILEELVNKDRGLRASALALVTRLLRRKMVHPQPCAPFLIAVCADVENALIAEDAFRVVATLDPLIVVQRLNEGFKRAFAFQMQGAARAANPILSDTGSRSKESVFGKLYAELASHGKQIRQNFIQQALSFLDKDGSKLEPQSFLWFIALAVASLPFQKEDEVLYVIHLINKTVPLRGASTELTLKKHFADGGESPANVTMTPNIVNELKSGLAVILLLQLKKFLKLQYGISDAKVSHFSPMDAAAKFAPVSARQIVVDYHIEFASPASSGWEADATLAFEIFASLKRALKDDEIDYSTHDGSRKKRKATPTAAATSTAASGTRKPRKKKAKQEEDEDDYE